MERFADIYMYVSGCVLTITLITITWYYGLFSRRNIPPGPWGYPIVGNLPMFGSQPHETFMRMREKYGDVFSLQIGSFPGIVINGNKAIREALIKHSGAFDDRPDFFSLTLAPLDSISLSPYSKRWTVYKKTVINTLHKFMNDKNAPLDSMLQDESVSLINDIMAHKGRPFNPKTDLYVSACSPAYQLCYGRGENVRADEDFKILLEANVTMVTAANPLECMPWLKYVMPWKSKPLRDLLALYYRILNKKVMEHKESFIADNLRDMTDAFLNTDDESVELQRVDIKREHLFGSLAEIIPAAFDTTATTLLWACMLMVKHQDIQQKVQEEIDKEVGNRRISVKSDRGNLPYTEAVILETMRLKPPIPTSLPHAAHKDTTFRGYDIRKGTVVIINLHSVMRDAEMFEHPDEFHPEHFLNKDGSLNTVKANFIVPFSLGVRKCVGEVLARNQLFMIFASIMQHFNLCKVDGEEYDMAGVNTLTDCPKPYKLIAQER